jgi:hypothetical protein
MSSRIDRKTVFTLSFVFGLLALVLIRTNGYKQVLPAWIISRISSQPSASPEDSIYAMLDAARAGDTKSYLDSFSSPVREQLSEVIKENSEPKFAEYLKSQNAALQSVAVSIPDRLSDFEARARVEYVYADRNEVQSLYLRKESARWRIFKIVGADQIKTLVPLGSTVND